MKKRVTLTNNFHNTEATVLGTVVGGNFEITRNQYKNALRKLCGIKGCTCGGDRPVQTEDQGDRIMIWNDFLNEPVR